MKMKKEIDYKKVYSKHYKNLPNYIFQGIAIWVTIGSISVGTALFNFDEVFLGLLVLFGGVALAWILAFLSRIISILALSQKIVITDAVLALQHSTATADIDVDELPEL